MKKINTVPEFLGETKDARTIGLFRTLLEISKMAEAQRKLLIVQAGFAVELAAGKITREDHSDLDLVVLEEDLTWFKERLLNEGYKIKYHEGKNPAVCFCAYRWYPELEDCLYIDFDGVKIKGEEVSDTGGGTKFTWPIKASELFWEREVENRKVKFLSPEIVYKFKKTQQKRDIKREKEKHDFRILEGLLPKK